MRVLLTSGGVPIGGERVDFTILDGALAGGAWIEPLSANTDAAGVATTQVYAMVGDKHFTIRASSGEAWTDVPISVAPG